MIGKEEKFVASMLGLALADALGAPHEGGPVARPAWRLIARGRLRWTDDTQMAMGLAESLITNKGVNPDSLARNWANRMDPMRGYGPGTRRLLQRIATGEDWRIANQSVFPDGSFGNGAAMRAAPLGLFYHRHPDELGSSAELASSITHAHPLGIDGGVLIARAVALALGEPFEPREYLKNLHDSCRSREYQSRLELAGLWLDADPTPGEIRQRLGNSILAVESAVTAVYVFCRFHDDYRAMIESVIGLGGDTDTIGAMAGGIFGARSGVEGLPKELLNRLEAREVLEGLGRDLYTASMRLG